MKLSWNDHKDVAADRAISPTYSTGQYSLRRQKLKPRKQRPTTFDNSHLHLDSSTFHCTPAIFPVWVFTVFPRTFPWGKFLPLKALSRYDSCMHLTASDSHYNLVSFQGPAISSFPRIFLAETVLLWKVLSIHGLTDVPSPVTDKTGTKRWFSIPTDDTRMHYEHWEWRLWWVAVFL